MSQVVNVEFKARCADLEAARQAAEAAGAALVGHDHQRDVYFCVPDGRLKLRLGTIERALIRYHRADHAGARRSDVTLFHAPDLAALEPLLAEALGVEVVVDKRRAIYRCGAAKLHLDAVAGVGTFVEVEIIDETGARPLDEMQAACAQWQTRLGVTAADFEPRSYADLVRCATLG